MADVVLRRAVERMDAGQDLHELHHGQDARRRPDRDDGRHGSPGHRRRRSPAASASIRPAPGSPGSSTRSTSSGSTRAKPLLDELGRDPANEIVRLGAAHRVRRGQRTGGPVSGLTDGFRAPSPGRRSSPGSAPRAGSASRARPPSLGRIGVPRPPAVPRPDRRPAPARRTRPRSGSYAGHDRRIQLPPRRDRRS